MTRAQIDRALVKFRSGFYQSLAQFGGFGKADLLASFALFDDNPSTINSLEGELRKVRPALVQRVAAQYLRN